MRSVLAELVWRLESLSPWGSSELCGSWKGCDWELGWARIGQRGGGLKWTRVVARHKTSPGSVLYSYA